MRDTQHTALYFAYGWYRVKERKGKSVLAASVPRHMTKECQIRSWLWRKPLISVNHLTPLQLQTPLQRRVRRNGKPSTPTWNTLFVFKELFIGGMEYGPSTSEQFTSCRSTAGPFPTVLCLALRNTYNTLPVLTHKAHISLYLPFLFPAQTFISASA